MFKPMNSNTSEGGGEGVHSARSRRAALSLSRDDSISPGGPASGDSVEHMSGGGIRGVGWGFGGAQGGHSAATHP